MPEAIAAWYRDLPCHVAGAVDASLDDAVDYSRLLSAAGLAVHVEFSPQSTESDRLRRIVRAARPSPVNVHLLAPDAAVDDVLYEVVSLAPQRIILSWDAFTVRRARVIRAADVRAWVAVWDEWGGRLPARWGVDPDGILVLLSEPGGPDRCRIRHVKVISAVAAAYPAIALAAAGGITEAAARLCLSAGAQQIVIGKALRPDGAGLDLRRDSPMGPTHGLPEEAS